MTQSIKICRVCATEKNVCDFYHNERVCKRCRNARHTKPSKPRTAEQKKAQAIRDKERRRRNKEKIALQKKEYYEKNKESYLAKCKALYYREQDQIKSRHAKYRKEHRQQNINNVFRHNSISRVMAAGFNAEYREDITKQDVYAEHGNICYICGEMVNMQCADIRLRPCVDHVIPISKGGAHIISNLRIVHFSCNSRKHSKLPSELKLSLPIDHAFSFAVEANEYCPQPLND